MANDSVVDRKIVQVREMTLREAKKEGWEDCMDNSHGLPTVLVLDDGTLLYPSQDSEGNGPGAIFGCKNGKHFCFA